MSLVILGDSEWLMFEGLYQGNGCNAKRKTRQPQSIRDCRMVIGMQSIFDTVVSWFALLQSMLGVFGFKIGHHSRATTSDQQPSVVIAIFAIKFNKNSKRLCAGCQSNRESQCWLLNKAASL